MFFTFRLYVFYFAKFLGEVWSRSKYVHSYLRIYLTIDYFETLLSCVQSAKTFSTKCYTTLPFRAKPVNRIIIIMQRLQGHFSKADYAHTRTTSQKIPQRKQKKNVKVLLSQTKGKNITYETYNIFTISFVFIVLLLCLWLAACCLYAFGK